MTIRMTHSAVDLSGTLARLAEFAAGYRSAPAEAIQPARDALEDVIACMLAGRDDPSTEAVSIMTQALGLGPALAVGTTLRLAAPYAALVSGTAAHALDFDDNFEPGLTHASAIAAPALFALADAEDLQGEAVVAHHILALELQARIASLFGPETYDRGWHSTSSLGAIGTAGACASLIGLDAKGVRAAMTIACSMSSGTKKQFGSDMKAVHAGLAAQAAVHAALLARAGIRGTEDPLGGRMGLVGLMSLAPTAERAAAATADLGMRWALVDHGVLPKRFPCCGAAHRALDGLAMLHQENDLAAAEIAAIEVTVNRVAAQNLRFDRPETVAEARFSLTYPAARVVTSGRLSLLDMTPEALADPAMRSLAAKVAILHDPEAPFDLDFPTPVRIRLGDGRVLETTVTIGKGSLKDPFTREDTQFKFADCCRWAGVDAAAARNAVTGLAHLPFRETARTLEDIVKHRSNRIAAETETDR